jgi:hypothetical protein
MISQGWKTQRRPEAEAPLTIKRVSLQGGPNARGGWLSDMLGKSGSGVLREATRQRLQGSRIARPAAPTTLRMRAVDPSEAPQAQLKPKGYLRIALLAFGGLVLALRARPWLSSLSIKMPLALAPVEKPLEKAPDSAPKAPAASALLDAGGSPLALWRSASGQWFGVNTRAQLSRMPEADATTNLKLPRLEGPGLASEEKRNGHILELQIDPAELSQLLPLRPDLAAAVDSVLLQGGSVSLRLHNGTLAALGESDFKRKQDRLVAVLADLLAKGKRPGSVDLRYDNTAVVRLASR